MNKLMIAALFCFFIGIIIVGADNYIYQDSFNDGSVNTTKWNVWGTYAETTDLKITGVGGVYSGIQLKTPLNISNRDILAIVWLSTEWDAGGNYFGISVDWDRENQNKEAYSMYNKGPIYAEGGTISTQIGVQTSGVLTYVKQKVNNTAWCITTLTNSTISCTQKTGYWNLTFNFVQLVSHDMHIYNFTVCEDQNSNWLCGDAPSTPVYLSINITYPIDSLKINSNFYINVSGNSSMSCLTNSSQYSLFWNNNTFYSFINNTYLSSGYYSVKVNCSDPLGGINQTQTRNFYVDVSNPEINPDPLLLINNTVVLNGNLTTYINFSDNIEIYSINVTLNNGTIIFNVTNLGNNFYKLNISMIVDNTPNGSITARVCDSHTASSIPDLKIEKTKNGLRYVSKENFLGINDDWITIYPESYSDYLEANTVKLSDRYTFEFNKKRLSDGTEVFIVESNRYIDIAKSQSFGGHLIIPELNKWIDFNNGKQLSYFIERITNNKIKITISGLTGSNLKFNSIGELNCVTSTYYYANLNPSVSYTSGVLTGVSTSISLGITNDPRTISYINATLIYNGVGYYSGSTPNFTKSVTSPTVAGYFQMVPFYWQLGIDGLTYNLTAYNQTVGNKFLNNCSDPLVNTSSFVVNFRNISNDSASVVDAIISVEGDINFYNSVKDVSNYSLCIYPNYVNLSETVSIQYGHEGNYNYYEATTNINNITQYLTLYTQEISGTTTLTIMDLETYQPLADVYSTMYRKINGSWITIDIKNSDVTGRVQFGYVADVEYKFLLSKLGYSSKIFNLNPILFSSYDVLMQRNISLNITLDYNKIVLEFYPKIFYNNKTNNLTFLISSPFNELTSYGYTLTYPHGTSTSSGIQNSGEELISIFNISGAATGEQASLYYWYVTPLSGQRNFTAYIDIIVDTSSNNTMMSNKDKTYGMGIFERVLISVLIAVFIAGISALVGHIGAGTILSLGLYIYLVYIGFIPLWIILLPAALLILIIGSSSEG